MLSLTPLVLRFVYLYHKLVLALPGLAQDRRPFDAVVRSTMAVLLAFRICLQQKHGMVAPIQLECLVGSGEIESRKSYFLTQFAFYEVVLPPLDDTCLVHKVVQDLHATNVQRIHGSFGAAFNTPYLTFTSARQCCR